MTIGTFDTPHIGHAILVNKIRALAPITIVGVNSDRFVQEYKGFKPLYSERERMELMGELGILVVLNDGPGYALIQEHKPDLLVIGDDWLGRDYLQQIGMDARDLHLWGVSLLYVNATDGISTSDIKQRLA